MNAKIMALVAVAGLVCGLLGIVALTGSTPASAAPAGVNLTFRCKFPFIGEQDLRIHIATNMPTTAVVGKSTVPRLTFDTVSTVNSKTTKGLRALDAATIEGVAEAPAAVVSPDFPEGLNVRPKAAMVKTPVPPAGSFNVTAVGSTPGIVFDTPGKGRIVLKDIILLPLLKKADGSLTDLGQPKVPCVRTEGSNVLAEFTIVESDDKAPSRPGTPAVTAQSGTTVSLKWGKADDNLGLSGYEIYNGTTKVATTYGEETSTTVTGLASNTAYNLTVKARDYGGNLSEPSDPVAVTTGPDVPEKVPPTAPGRPAATLVGGTWVRMKWGESTDNVGVTAYDIYRDGQLAASFPATEAEGWVEGLQPLHTYTFTVRARDAAGNVSPFSPPLSARTVEGAPTGCGTYPNPPANLKTRGCIYMAGYTNVQKLNGAAVINDPQQDPVMANVAYRTIEDKEIQAEFKFSKPLRSRATFLTFGFMPTTATMELSQSGPGTMTGVYDDVAQGYRVKAKTKVWVTIRDATVNGAPLNLGKYCRTSVPMEIKLDAKAADFKDILEGGVLTGNSRIPSFSGCGATEDVDRLFIAAISGADNYIKIRQGPICKQDTASCPPVKPER